jgi:hypothetical protein
VVDDEVDVVPLILVLHVDSMPFFNTERKPKEPFIPRLKTGG